MIVIRRVVKIIIITLVPIKIVIKKYNNYYYDKNNKNFKRNKMNKILIEV